MHVQVKSLIPIRSRVSDEGGRNVLSDAVISCCSDLVARLAAHVYSRLYSNPCHTDVLVAGVMYILVLAVTIRTDL